MAEEVNKNGNERKQVLLGFLSFQSRRKKITVLEKVFSLHLTGHHNP